MMAAQATQIDATVEVVTPENISFLYQTAGPFRRLPAFFLDLLVRTAIFAGLTFALSILLSFAGLPNLAIAGAMIIWFLVDWFYGGAFEALMNGQTPGKWMLGIRVLSINGRPINGIQAILRNVLRSVDMFPVLSIETLGVDAPIYFIPTFMLSLVTMSVNRRFQRLGDIATGTMVVVEERRWLTGVAELDDDRAAQLASLLPTDFSISRSLAQSLSMYAERRRYFSAARRREVARHVAEPLLARFGFPADTGYDLLMCALYYRAFIADRVAEERSNVATSVVQEVSLDSARQVGVQ
jgi:uncharacterized RDD family membrane protein YckC